MLGCADNLDRYNGAGYYPHSQHEEYMSTELIPIGNETSLWASFAPRVSDYVQASRAENTLKGYRSDWRHFSGWCAATGLSSLPASPEAVASYLTTVADIGLKSGSIQRRVSAIAAFHVLATLERSTVAYCVCVAA